MEWTRLDEPFAVGAAGRLKAKGGEAAPFIVTEVVPGRVFADDTTLDGATLRIRHEAEPHGDGSMVTITGLIDGRDATTTPRPSPPTCSSASRPTSRRCGPCSKHPARTPEGGPVRASPPSG